MDIEPKTSQIKDYPTGTPPATPKTDSVLQTRMQVRKRNGSMEPVDVTKIIERVAYCCADIPEIDPLRVAKKAISGLYDGATTRELDELCIQTASLLIAEDPQYSKLAARLLNTYMEEELRLQKIRSFFDYVKLGVKEGLVSEKLYDFVDSHKAKLSAALKPFHTDSFEYFGLRTVCDRYLLRHPNTRRIIESPQYFFMRVACALAKDPDEAIELYKLISSHDYMPSTPTLFNAGTLREQMSSCYLLSSPEDDLKDIYQKYMDIALLSKFAGGIGVSYSKVRSRGSLIRGTNGHSNGIVPWLKTLDSSVAAVNQGGKRKGAACVYLETWHADILEFLELRDNTGDEARRTHNLNTANWIPDLFMKRVKEDGEWSLFDPKDTPGLVDLYGEAFEKAYTEAEIKGKAKKTLRARELYGKMMKTLAQTGNAWICFKDQSNKKSNQTGEDGNVIHLSNLCTEILEITNKKEVAVCNLGSVNLAKHVTNGKVDYKKLARTVQTALKFLNRVIDINFYPIEKAQYSNLRWRPVGLGVMGLQDLLFQLQLPFDSEEAKKISKKIQEEIYYNALLTSNHLAKKEGAHETFKETKTAKGILQFDLWEDVKLEDPKRWEELRDSIKKHGLRNSLVIAIAPTATIASIVGSYESIEVQVSNIFKRETLSGEFLQINRYLVEELRKHSLWTKDIRNKIKAANGSIQSVEEIPENIRHIYRTVWEVPMKAVIDMAAERGPFIDQSQSLNLFIENPSIGKLSSMYMYAWEKGLKTTYYLRSRPATSIAKATLSPIKINPNNTKTDFPSMAAVQESMEEASASAALSKEDAMACSLENPETCESCQ